MDCINLCLCTTHIPQHLVPVVFNINPEWSQCVLSEAKPYRLE